MAILPPNALARPAPPRARPRQDRAGDDDEGGPVYIEMWWASLAKQTK